MRCLGILGAIVLFLVGAFPAAAATATTSYAFGSGLIQKDCISTYLGIDVRQRVSGGEVVSSELFADLLRVSPDRSRGRLVANVAWRDTSTGEVVSGTINVTWTANDSNPVCGDPADLQRQADMTGTATLGERTFRFTLPDPNCSYLYRKTFELPE